MTTLRDAGLKTPESWRVSAEEIVTLTLVADQSYYCRTSVDGKKVTVAAAGAGLTTALAEHAGPNVEWLIQPLYDFPLGGAAYVDSTCTYVEVAHGSTIGLLRHGELAYAWYRGDVSWSRTSSQETQWTYANSELTPGIVPASMAEADARSTCETVAAELQASELVGLFEWARLDEMNYYLDLKLADVALSKYIHEYLDPRPAEAGSVAFDKPVFKRVAEISPATPVVFKRGARLSHAITYRCMQGFTNTYFSSW
jgi:hypothetical protein